MKTYYVWPEFHGHENDDPIAVDAKTVEIDDGCEFEEHEAWSFVNEHEHHWDILERNGSKGFDLFVKRKDSDETQTFNITWEFSPDFSASEVA